MNIKQLKKLVIPKGKNKPSKCDHRVDYADIKQGEKKLWCADCHTLLLNPYWTKKNCKHNVSTGPIGAKYYWCLEHEGKVLNESWKEDRETMRRIQKKRNK